MKKYLAEFIGTFWLVFGGCGSALLAAAFPDVGIGLVIYSDANNPDNLFKIQNLFWQYSIVHPGYKTIH